MQRNMHLSFFFLLLIILAGCSSDISQQAIQKLRKGGKSNLPKLYEIASRADDLKPQSPTEWVFDPTVDAMSVMADMMPESTPYMIDLLTLEGKERQLLSIKLLRGRFSIGPGPTRRIGGDDRAILAIIYSAIVDTTGRVDKIMVLAPYFILHKEVKLRRDLNLSLIDMSLWWLQNHMKYPKQILPRQWSKGEVLKKLVREVQKDPEYALKYSDLLAKILRVADISQKGH